MPHLMTNQVRLLYFSLDTVPS